MGLDIGDIRIGVALSDPLGILATPLKIITRKDGETGIGDIVDIVRENGVGRIIVGLPISMDGTIGKQAVKVKAYARELSACTDVPIEFKDERLSTVLAKRIVQDVRKTNRDTRYDAAAAALILQGYLDDEGMAERDEPGEEP